jgi:hypothetical protein
MALYIPRSIFHLARLLYVRPATFGPTLVGSAHCISFNFGYRQKQILNLLLSPDKVVEPSLLQSSATTSFCYHSTTIKLSDNPLVASRQLAQLTKRRREINNAHVRCYAYLQA